MCQVLLTPSPNTPTHCLRLPGQRLDLKALLKKKFHEPNGYKKGALAAFSEHQFFCKDSFCLWFIRDSGLHKSMRNHYSKKR